MDDATIIKLVAIGSITVLEAAALLSNLDGAFFGPAVALIGGLAGYELRGLNLKNKGGKG
jgi:hypothetical protein